MRTIYLDTRSLNHKVAAIINKLGFEISNMDPRAVINNVSHLATRIDDAGAILEVEDTQKEQIFLLILTYGTY